jgi:hypothetical protein
VSDGFDTSQIPDGNEHWDALAQRIADSVRRPAWDDWAQSRVGWLAASLLLAAALAYGLLPRDDTRLSFAPSDPLGQAFSRGAAPPAIASLLLGERGS